MNNVPKALVEDQEIPSGRGYLEDGWYIEEHNGAIRQAVKIVSKLHEEHSKFQKITVYQSNFFGRFLTLDDLMMFTERDEFVYHEMLTHIPLCSIPEPKQVLIIGGGDCGCLREVLLHPSVERVVQCDIDERVTCVSAEWFKWPSDAMKNSRAQVIFEDGIEYIKNNKNAFDLIIIDSTDPIGAAVGLFVRDFYTHVSQALKPAGVMVAQTESPHWSAAMVGTIFSEIKSVFTHVSPYLGYIPTYPSGVWSWAYASNTIKHNDYFDGVRSHMLGKRCRYYNSDLQKGAFLLPNFARQATEDINIFNSFDKAHKKLSGKTL